MLHHANKKWLQHCFQPCFPNLKKANPVHTCCAGGCDTNFKPHKFAMNNSHHLTCAQLLRNVSCENNHVTSKFAVHSHSKYKPGFTGSFFFFVVTIKLSWGENNHSVLDIIFLKILYLMSSISYYELWIISSNYTIKQASHW